MRVYLAAPYALRNMLRAYADELANSGHECTSTWLVADHAIHPGTLGTSPDSDDDYIAEHVEQDLEDVARADALVLVSWEYAETFGVELGFNSGGRHVETGYALALGVPVIVLGQPENVFHRGRAAMANTWEDVITQLGVIHDKRFGITSD